LYLVVTDALNREWAFSYIGFDIRSAHAWNTPSKGRVRVAATIPTLLVESTLGSVEGFIALLIEHFGGALPLWLAPEQVRVIPVGENNREKVNDLLERIEGDGLRVRVDFGGGKLTSKVRTAQHDRVPYTLVVGDQELASHTLSVRPLDQKEKRGVPLASFLEELRGEIREKNLPKK
jgi:threonyl-tRNA synthetase